MNSSCVPLALLGGALFAAVSLVQTNPGQPLACARLGLLGGTLTAAAAYDLRSRRIPNRLVLPASLALLPLHLPGHPSSRLIAAAAIVAAAFALSFAQPRALGMGDSKLALLILSGLGAAATAALVAGLACAALASLWLVLSGGRAALGRSLPLAPFLLLGTLGSLVLSA
jgi:Flp pilus assembly protein protease CpaA